MHITDGEYAIDLKDNPNQKMLSYFIAKVIEDTIRN